VKEKKRPWRRTGVQQFVEWKESSTSTTSTTTSSFSLTQGFPFFPFIHSYTHPLSLVALLLLSSS
jgi:hypothetical protein